MAKGSTNRIDELLASVTTDLMGDGQAALRDNSIRVERLLLEMVRPDPVQPRRVLPESIHLRFHNNHVTPTAWREIEGLNVPCGIVIPWIVDDTVWGIKVRRATGEQRYQQVSGGNIRGCLYMADRILPRTPLIITEGEFDALIAWQVGGDFARAAAIGSASHARIDRRWYGTLLSVPRVIACMDADAAGAGAAAQLAALSGAVRCLQVPSGKDLSDFYQQPGENVVKEWLQTVINEGVSL